ncbi:MAG: DUF4044 domain-containing protein [Acidimicrobiia bacterium]|nr:DUF4044 domain-containing protein [Acidimicrobiia bacterium]
MRNQSRFVRITIIVVVAAMILSVVGGTVAAFLS